MLELNAKSLLTITLSVLLLSFTIVNAQTIQKEAYAVNLGFPVTYSTIYNQYENIFIPRLDIVNNGWAAKYVDLNQWIQVSSSVPQKWIGVVIQGRAQNPNKQRQWVTKFKVSYSNDGNNWSFVDGGNEFTGNNDQTSKVKSMFKKAVVARTIRIVPTAWSGWISLRFDFIFAL